MRRMRPVAFTIAVALGPSAAHSQPLTTAGQPARLEIRAAGERSLRVTLGPANLKGPLPPNPSLLDRVPPAPAVSLSSLSKPVRRRIGSLDVEVTPGPLTLRVRGDGGRLVQELVFEADGRVSFRLDGQPVLGMGEGGPRPERGRPWREQPVQFDRRGALDTMEPRWQSDMYGSRNPVAMLLGTGGWGLFVAAPWVHVDLRDASRGVFLPWTPTGAEVTPQTERNQQQNAGKGLPPIDAIVPGFFDLFVFDARDPAKTLGEFAAITGPAVLPPRWALGYMQSHRTLENDRQMLGVIDTFRSKRIPLDAVIYLGTGFAPRGWNTQAAVVRVQSGRLHPRSHGGARRHARPPRQGGRAHGAVGSRQAGNAARLDPRRARRIDRRLAHPELLAAARAAGQRRRRRVLARRGGLVQSPRADQAASAVLPGLALDPPRRPAVESAAQRLPGHRAVGRLGVVGRYRQRLEDPGGADRGRDQLLAQHRSVLGIRHRRLLSEQRADRRALRALAPVRGILRVVPLARPDLAPAAALGLGLGRHGTARVQQHQRADPARRPPQRPRSRS